MTVNRYTRRVVQGLFLGLVVVGVFGLQANCERWCPFGGVEAIYTYAVEGNMLCSLGVSNFFILGGVLAATLLLRRAFCGYICPIGTISEWLHSVARRMGVRKLHVSRKWDRLLRLCQYGVLAIVLALTYRAGELIFRGFDPCYALLSQHGEDITVWAYITSGAIVIASMLIILPFCRWLCPLAAVLNPFSRFGWTAVHRDSDSCHACGRCARHCPMQIPVDKLPEVIVSRCISCLECVDVCPAPRFGQRALRWGPRWPRGRRWPQSVLIGVLLFCTLGAVTASYLVPVPSFLKQRDVPPRETATVVLKIEDLTCRGRANLFAYFLERDDEFAVPGYLRIAAWPGPGWADVHITFDPAQTDLDALQRAITEPYFETDTNFWRASPFSIQGYDPLLAP
ncbi:MAG: 4Fe-4S binding protein [Pirellulaceae bacterium]